MKIYLDGTNISLEMPGMENPAVMPSHEVDWNFVSTGADKTVIVHDLTTGAFYADLATNIINESDQIVADPETYLNSFVGSSTAAGGGATGAGVETWVYKNSDYTPTARLTLSHNAFTETVISNNVDLLDKTEATEAHDGSKYVFTENDMVQVSLNVKIDANTSANLLRFKVRSKDGNYTIRQAHADTNIQQFGQILTFHFTPFAVNAGTASAGFDITVSGFTSTADAFIYNIQQIIQKVGEKV